MRPVSAIEAAAIVSVAGSLLAIAAPAFVRNVHASRASEAVDGLERIATSAVAYAADRELSASFPQSASLTPAQVPRGTRVLDPPGTWDTPTWKALGFGFDSPHSYSFELEVQGEPARMGFRARAHGDLNGDGILSTFEVAGERRAGEAAVVLPGMVVNREVE